MDIYLNNAVIKNPCMQYRRTQKSFGTVVCLFTDAIDAIRRIRIAVLSVQSTQ